MKILIDTIASIAESDFKYKPVDITDERWEKVLRIRPLEDKKRSLLAGKLLNQMCEACGIKKPVYGTEGSGKPVLSSHPQISFSVSHSGEYVVLVYEENIRAIGVDIQQIREVSKGVKKRILHEKEWMYFRSEAGRKEESVGETEAILLEENRLLNRIWAIKESYVKMTGEGLAHDFRKLCINFEEGTVTDEDGNCACYEELKVPDAYVAAVTRKN